ncbi:MAG TPA: TetR/AcrR family transcriptional regulator [Acidimicrobiales bacterium]|nr:TetR/AcrR family transcriptional regulator [Acidimicrobiales bacterium]
MATTRSEAPVRRGGRPSRRDEILRSAMDLFASGGSRGTCLADIAHQTGLAPSAILHHFGSKDALLMEVLAAIDERDAAIVPRAKGQSAWDRLSALRDWAIVLERDQGRAQLARLATVLAAEGLNPEHPAHGPIVARFRRLRASVAHTIRLAQKEGSVRGDADARRVAAEVVGAMLGVQFQWLLDSATVPLHDLYRAYFDRLLGDLATR